MRAVRFIERVEFDFSGNVSTDAIALGDVDNDGLPELIVGNNSGEVSIFKGEECWQKITGLGMINAIGVGDVMNCGSNALVIVSGDGWCHLYLCLQSKDEEPDGSESQGKLQPVHVQRIPPNTKVLLIADIDDNGLEELVLGLTDRVVRFYRWLQNATSGKFVCLSKLESAGQIGSITFNRNHDGSPCLLVSQPGGTLMKIPCNTSQQTSESNSLEFSVIYHPLASNKLRNPSISTEIIGNFDRGLDKPKDKGTPYAVATLDGTLMFFQDEQLHWSLHLENQLFALSKLDINNDGFDEIIACSWNGHTYILDQKKHCVLFQLEESVSVFCAGLYTLKPPEPPVPCFIYVTFNNKIYIYYNITLPSLPSKSFIDHICAEKQLEGLLSENLVSDKSKLKQLIQWCLYSKHNRNMAAD